MQAHQGVQDGQAEDDERGRDVLQRDMLTIAVPTSTSCMRSWYCRRNAFQRGSFGSSASLFGPYSGPAFGDLGRGQADVGIDVELPADLVRGQ